NMPIQAASRWDASVRRHLRGTRAHLQEETALVRGLARPKILDLDGVGWHPLLVVVNFNLDQVWAPHLRPVRQLPRDPKGTQTRFAQHSGDDDQREEDPEKHVQQIV